MIGSIAGKPMQWLGLGFLSMVIDAHSHVTLFTLSAILLLHYIWIFLSTYRLGTAKAAEKSILREPLNYSNKFKKIIIQREILTSIIV